MPGGIPELGVVGGRCEVGEASELWDVVASMYTVCGRGQKFGRVMRLGHVIRMCNMMENGCQLAPINWCQKMAPNLNRSGWRFLIEIFAGC